MRVLVTGANGFVGGHLVQELSERGHKVFKGVRDYGNRIASNNNLVYFDLNNLESVKYAILVSKPDAIVHLAAQSNVPRAWGNPQETIEINTLGTIKLLEVVSSFSPSTKILTVGSSEEYGITAKYRSALSETDPCFPQNPYASSKLAVSDLVMQLSTKYHLNAMHVRSFNHFGPGQRKGFVVSDFASQIAEIENGLIPRTISVGNLNVHRDFTDVRDIVTAYAQLLESEVNSGIYNICSGIPRNISDILNILIGFSKVKIDVSIDKSKFRPIEVEKFVGNNSKLKSSTNWEPSRNFEKSLFETLEWWRKEIKARDQLQDVLI